jgi:exonuclease III
VVRDLARDTKCTIAALQETKLDSFSAATVRETLGEKFATNFAFLPAQGTRGGVLIAVDEDYYTLQQAEFRDHSITVLLKSVRTEEEWWFTAVYGPQGDQEKLLFLQELKDWADTVGDNWLIMGDFNLILSAADKNNNHLNRRLMGEFRSVVNDLQLKEMNLRGRKFTWSNDTTQTRIDRAFCTVTWDLMSPSSTLQAISSLASDHCPLLLVGGLSVRKYEGFRFESFWPSLERYNEVVSTAWN